jgi:hypothetical protein
MNHILKNTSVFLMLLILAACAAPREALTPAESSTLSDNEQHITPTATLPSFEPVPSGLFDNGRMWTFEHAPVEYFRQTYQFNPDEAWFERARLGAVRLPNCSGSFISANGLVMTNHHCAREQISQVSLPGEDLLDHGFYAETLSDERHIENYHVDQLVDIRDVTAFILDEIDSAPAENRAEIRRSAVERVQSQIASEFTGQDDIIVQVVSLYNGGLYSAYIFRRYNDIRMVMAPELQIGYYGGDDDNFTYPRYNLDMTFYRVYVDDIPLNTPFYFPFSSRGVEEGDAVFLIGNPGNTTRQQTVAQLTYRGLYGDRFRAMFISRVIEALDAFYAYDQQTAEEMELRNYIFSLKNADKFYGGQVQALQDPFLMGRRTDNELRFRAAIGAEADLADVYFPIIDRIEEIQLAKIPLSPVNYPGLGISPNSRLSSSVMQRALYAYLYDAYRNMGTPLENLQPLRSQIESIRDKPEYLDRMLLTSRLRLFADILGPNHPTWIEMSGGNDIDFLVDEIMELSMFTSAEATLEILDANLSETADPALIMVATFAPELFQAQEAYQTLIREENELLSQLGRAWYAVYGTSIPPDATFSLRISDGVVSSYEYNGTRAPAYTTFYGLYDRAHSHHTDAQWALPERWQKPSLTLNLATPVNFVSTNDIIGGNSGSPIVNTSLEIVGLAFDSNIEGMGSSDFILDDRSARAVSVDSRGMIESLRHVYKAERLVREILNPSQR